MGVDISTYLIVVADDFGYHIAVDEGIEFCAEKGILTSASVLIKGDDLGFVNRFAKKHQDFDLGLHLNLEDMQQKGKEQDANTIYALFINQIRLFERIFNKYPSNLSFHHSREARMFTSNTRNKFYVLVAMRMLEEKTSIPLRQSTSNSIHTVRVYDSLYETKLRFIKLTSELHDRINIIITHPGYEKGKTKGFISSYGLKKRNMERLMLSDKKVKTTLSRISIKLTDFNKVAQS